VSTTDDSAVIRFVRLADQYCRLMESGTTSCKRLLRQTAELLPDLFAAAIHLPAGHKSSRLARELDLVWQDVQDRRPLTDKERTRARLSRYHHTCIPTGRFFAISRRLARIFGEHNLYREVFDPYKDRDSCETTLSNALAEIWHDVKPMLLLFQMGDEPAMRHAVYRWALDVRLHWGDVHCCDALKAIFFALKRVHDDWEFPEFADRRRSKPRGGNRRQQRRGTSAPPKSKATSGRSSKLPRLTAPLRTQRKTCRQA
jgi:hypothetical protein